MFVLDLFLQNATNNVSGLPDGVSALAGHWEILAGGIILLVAFFVVMFLLKNIIANAIIGIIALLVVKFVFGIAIPLNGLTILVSVLGGLGGVAALLIAAFIGWL